MPYPLIDSFPERWARPDLCTFQMEYPKPMLTVVAVAEPDLGAFLPVIQLNDLATYFTGPGDPVIILDYNLIE